MLFQPLVRLLRGRIAWPASILFRPAWVSGVRGDGRRVLVGLFFLMGFWVGDLRAQVSLLNAPASVVEQSGALASKSLVYTIGGGSNRLLVVTTNGYAAVAEVASVTFGGVPLSRGVAGTFGTARSSIWYLALGSGAAPIAAPVVVTYSANFFFDLSAMAFQGVDQATPVSGAAISYVPGLTVPSATGDLAVSTILGLSFGLTAGAGQTIQATNLIDAGTVPVFSGTSTALGAATVDMTWGVFLTAPLHLALNVRQAAAITLTPASLPAAALNVAGYSSQIAATGGRGAKTFAVTSGALPPGLTLTPGGALSGTPTSSGSFAFTVTATDTVGATGARAFTLGVSGPLGGGGTSGGPTPPSLAIVPVSLPGALLNAAYNQTITATGGSGATTFVASSGALPPGLALGASGGLGGVPTVAGSYAFVITARDAAGASATRGYAISVNVPGAAPQMITFAEIPDKLVTDAPIALVSRASSGLPVAYVVSGPAQLDGVAGLLVLTGVPGTVTITASQAGNASFLAAPEVVRTFVIAEPPASARLVNLSSRARITPDPARSLIAGLVIRGSGAKRVVLRGVGPGLGGFGVTGFLANPSLQVFDAAGRMILANDDWSGVDTAAAFGQVGAFGFVPGSKDAALFVELAPGAYTLQVGGGIEPGVTLAEVFDAGTTPGSEPAQLVNLSARGTVEAGEGLLIGGFVVQGYAPKRVLVRGIGPGLAAFSVPGALADPRLAIFQGTILVAQNDDWSVPSPLAGQPAPAPASELAAAAQATGAFAVAVNSLDAAVLVTLPPGAYTAQVTGAGGAGGVALVEIYEVP